ncbi:hypothetical protein EU96_1544 [Prochlorococcus marinus str. MIT 9302]|uniref:Uncharacterized protein n=1 Tax=Prochlorococcus marinus str. MIT 9302 TaxID=74545 RepID=A0A0A2A7T2_PROMR|nr:hypothetical protein [Prochlorococcus marinus]KGF96906.1 hypothetical protein EU96_1544 [Prochlorococcus marinus str. MIT 9302]
MKKPLLIIYGKNELDISKYGEAYIYKLSSLKIKSSYRFKVLNNPSKLDEIAENEKKSYINWIYSIGNMPIYRKVSDLINFDLFLLGDLASMRNEIYQTFNALCNIKYLKILKKEYKPSSIELINLPIEYEKLIYHNLIKKYYLLNNIHLTFKSTLKKLFLLNKVIIKIIIFSIKNIIYNLIINFIPYKNFRYNNKLNLYLTRFPLHFNNSNKEEKYSFMFDQDCNNNVYLIDIISDGVHQNLSLFECLRSIKRLLKLNSKFILLDKFINFYDYILIFMKMPLIFITYIFLINKNYSYKNINLSFSIHIEQIYSLSKNIRLLFLSPKIERISKNKFSKNIIYTIFEYPYGRLVSYFFNNSGFIKTIGMQHGPSSTRKLYHYSKLSNKNSDYFPSQILSEDYYSMQIYKESKYKNISIMKKIPRLDYLSNFKGSIENKYNLIFGGLHDSNSILIELEEYIKSTNIKFIFKPHPRSNLSNETKSLIEGLDNLETTNEHFINLLRQCNSVFCTYTSIGYEAILLNFDVKIIDLPGSVNLSQLADIKFIKSEKISNKIEFISRKSLN